MDAQVRASFIEYKCAIMALCNTFPRARLDALSAVLTKHLVAQVALHATDTVAVSHHMLRALCDPYDVVAKADLVPEWPYGVPPSPIPLRYASMYRCACIFMRGCVAMCMFVC